MGLEAPGLCEKFGSAFLFLPRLARGIKSNLFANPRGDTSSESERDPRDSKKKIAEGEQLMKI